jgi:hypothetical protein
MIARPGSPVSSKAGTKLAGCHKKDTAACKFMKVTPATKPRATHSFMLCVFIKLNYSLQKSLAQPPHMGV